MQFRCALLLPMWELHNCIAHSESINILMLNGIELIQQPVTIFCSTAINVHSFWVA